MAKKIIRCLACNEVTKFYGSYVAEIKERTVATLTGEIKEQEVRGKICRQCAVNAGYEVKAKDG
jgi:hypothetical protein